MTLFRAPSSGQAGLPVVAATLGLEWVLLKVAMSLSGTVVQSGAVVLTIIFEPLYLLNA